MTKVEVTSEERTRLEAVIPLVEQAPRPACWGHCWMGTAGWTDPSLLEPGLFYPRGTQSASARLSYYSQHFSFVEVDSSFYTLLPRTTTERWTQDVSCDFRFDIKAHPVLTGHPLTPERLPKDLRQALGSKAQAVRLYPRELPSEVRQELLARFLDSLEPLRASGQLASVLLQFPPWFDATRGHARYLEALASSPALSDLVCMVELRNAEWFEPGRRERLFTLLREHGYGFVCVDEPNGQLGGVPPIVAVTNPALSVLRFHGQNLAGWVPGASVAERFRWVYTRNELEPWVERLRALTSECEAVHVVFNNCVRNYAVLGAKTMARLLEVSGENSG